VSLVGLLGAVIVIGLIVYLVSLLPLPAPFKNIAMILVILIAIIWLVTGTGVFGTTMRIR
jgi:hypothetical protein